MAAEGDRGPVRGGLVHIVGARPNFMKAAPVIRALAGLGVAQVVVHTGQHYDRQMSDVFFEELGLPEPDVNLGVGSGSHAVQTAAIMVRLEETFGSLGPRGVVVYGDVNSTIAAALVAAKLMVPVAHVEAGLRSFDRTMPEEVNRVVTDQLSDLLFTTSPEAVANLLREGVAGERVHFVGNPMIDTLLANRGAVRRLRRSAGSSASPATTPSRPSTARRTWTTRAPRARIVGALSAAAAQVVGRPAAPSARPDRPPGGRARVDRAADGRRRPSGTSTSSRSWRAHVSSSPIRAASRRRRRSSASRASRSAPTRSARSRSRHGTNRLVEPEEVGAATGEIRRVAGSRPAGHPRCGTAMRAIGSRPSSPRGRHRRASRGGRSGRKRSGPVS